MLDLGALNSVAGVTAARVILATVERTARENGDIPLANAARFRMLQIDGERSAFPRRQLDWIFYEQLTGYLVRPLRPLRTLLLLILVGTAARYLVDAYRERNGQLVVAGADTAVMVRKVRVGHEVTGLLQRVSARRHRQPASQAEHPVARGGGHRGAVRDRRSATLRVRGLEVAHRRVLPQPGQLQRHAARGAGLGEAVRRGAVLVAGLLVVAACGGGGGGVTPGAAVSVAGTEQAGDGGQGNGPAKEAVGTVTGIVPVGGQVAGAAAFEGQDVARQDVISTEANGKIIFSLGQLVPFCQVETASEVEVAPSGVTLVQIRKGTALCRTSTNGQLKQFVAGNTVLTAADPVFLLGWDGKTATVQVAQGYVRIESNAGATVLGANQQAQSGSRGIGVGPWEPASIEDRQTRDAAMTQLDQALGDQPSVRYPRLDASQSPILADAAQAGGLVVGVDQSQLQTFVQELLGNMGSLWGVDVSVRSGTKGSIVVTSAPPRGAERHRPRRARRHHLLRGAHRGRPRARGQAMRAFLAAALQARCPQAGGGAAAPGQSCYEDAYRVQVGADLVPLGPLAPYLGLA